MTLRLITAPAALTVSLETAKAYLRVDGTTEDALITLLLKSASEMGEGWARRAFITQTLEQTLDDWPEDNILTVWRPPLQSVTSVKYKDEDGAELTWANTNYVVDIASQPGTISFSDLPSVTLQDTGGITVRFVAGYGAADTSVPECIKQAVLDLVAFLYENRGMEVPAHLRAPFVRERVVWF